MYNYAVLGLACECMSHSLGSFFPRGGERREGVKMNYFSTPKLEVQVQCPFKVHNSRMTIVMSLLSPPPLASLD